MEHQLTSPHYHHHAPLHPQMEITLHKILDIAIPVFLMMGVLPLLKKFLVWLLMTLYEIFIQHQYLF